MSHGHGGATTAITLMDKPTQTSVPAAAVDVGSGPLLGWAYARHEDSEDWRGLWPTRDLAIEHGLSDYGDEECFWIAEAGPSSNDEWDFEIVGRPEKVEPNDSDQPHGR